MKGERAGGEGEPGTTTPEGGGRLGGVLLWGTVIIGIGSVLLISPENEGVRRFLESLGPFAPLAYFLAELVQVVVIPIPGQPFEVAGGWLLGLWGGSLVGSLGALTGSVLAFGLGRRFGRPWVERHTSAGVRRKVFGRLEEGQRAEWIIFWLMMIPNFPRDPLCYVAGVSGMSMRAFLLIALLGRPVGLVPWVALGAEGAAAGLAWQLGMIGVASAIWLASRLPAWLAGPSLQDPGPEGEG